LKATEDRKASREVPVERDEKDCRDCQVPPDFPGQFPTSQMALVPYLDHHRVQLATKDQA